MTVKRETTLSKLHVLQKGTDHRGEPTWYDLPVAAYGGFVVGVRAFEGSHGQQLAFRLSAQHPKP